jgi:pimeloyl-ACP methyl ester carboxylesterase
MTVQADIERITRGSAAGIGYLRRGGNGQTLVLLHGIGSNAESFSALMNALPPSVDAIAWDAPGYGVSTPLNPLTPAPKDYAAALEKFLDALKLPRVALAGHSLGCLFSGSFAANYPGRISSLTLMSPALGYRVAPGEALPPGVQSRIDEINALGPKAFAAKRAARLIDDAKAKPEIVAAVEKAMGSVHLDGYAQAVHALGAGDLLASAMAIAAPVMVAVGAKDVVTPPDNARALHAALTHPAGFHEIPDAGHALPQEQPAIVAKLLAGFIAEHAHG